MELRRYCYLLVICVTDFHSFADTTCQLHSLAELDPLISRRFDPVAQAKAHLSEAKDEVRDAQAAIASVPSHEAEELEAANKAAKVANAKAVEAEEAVEAALKLPAHISLLEFMVKHNLYQCHTPLIRQLVRDKWDTYGRSIFLFQAFWYAVSLFFTLLVIMGRLPPILMLTAAVALHLGPHAGWLAARATKRKFEGKRCREIWHYVNKLTRITSFAYSLSVTLAFLTILFEDGIEAVLTDGDPPANTQTLLAIATLCGWLHFILILRGFRSVGTAIMMLEGTN